jgi:phage baseplate assembly protein W
MWGWVADMRPVRWCRQFGSSVSTMIFPAVETTAESTIKGNYGFGMWGVEIG